MGAFGRNFWDITPQSKLLQDRLEQDWRRLRNIMKVLIEVGLENCGRQVTVSSLFTVLNRTSHEVRILCHPNPSFSPTESLSSVGTGDKPEVRPCYSIARILQWNQVVHIMSPPCCYMKPYSKKVPIWGAFG